MVLPVGEVEPGAGQGALALHVDVIQTCLNQLAARRNNGGQVTRAGAVAGRGQVDLLFRQRQQAVLAATDRAVQALVLSKVRFQLLGAFPCTSLALCLQLVEFGTAGSDRGVLPGPWKQR
ncbi:hypothetical protein D3C80_1789780 [compost metagenome]